MRDLEEILENRKLKILFHINQPGIIRIGAKLNDPVTRKSWLVYFTRAMGWEHLSVGSNMKTPDWDTMCLAKDIFFRPDECCVEYHPKEEDYVNMHEHTLHVWKEIDKEFPAPPSIMVGLKGITPEETRLASRMLVDSLSDEEITQLCEKRGIKANRAMRRKQ